MMDLPDKYKGEKDMKKLNIAVLGATGAVGDAQSARRI